MKTQHSQKYTNRILKNLTLFSFKENGINNKRHFSISKMGLKPNILTEYAPVAFITQEVTAVLGAVFLKLGVKNRYVFLVTL